MNDPRGFPTIRLRRLRHHPGVRRLVRRTTLEPGNLILPLFVGPGEQQRRPIGAMPGQFQWSLDLLGDEIRDAASRELGGVILFGIPPEKDAAGSDSVADDGIIQQAVRVARDAAGEMPVMTDVCFCEYTDHGHCGTLSERSGRMDVDNDLTLRGLAQQAVSHARAGADVVAPSGMMDGMVAAIRAGLDQAGFEHIPIMSYAAKFASGFYGPFREAVDSAPSFGDRRAYQMDPAAGHGQAMREVELDIAEGADVIMVKPALAYLDVIAQVRSRYPDLPLAAYNVSGEYSMVKAAAEKGWIDEQTVALESLIAIRRAGADMILTYWARDVADWLA